MKKWWGIPAPRTIGGVQWGKYIQGVPKKMVFSGKMAIATFKLIQNEKMGVFCKIQDICYKMGTEIFKMEKEMTEKFKPKVAKVEIKKSRHQVVLNTNSPENTQSLRSRKNR